MTLNNSKAIELINKLDHVLAMNSDVMTSTGVQYITYVIEELKIVNSWVNSWANYRATDSDGRVYEYELEPNLVGDSWTPVYNSKWSFISEGPLNSNWADSLEHKE